MVWLNTTGISGSLAPLKIEKTGTVLSYSIYGVVTCEFSGKFGLIRIVGSVKSK